MTPRDGQLAASDPLGLLRLGDRELLISPANRSRAASIGVQIYKHVRTETPLARLVHDPAYKELEPDVRLALCRDAAAVQVAGGRSLSDVELLEGMTHPAVLAFAIFLHAYPNHPDLRLEEVKRHVTDDNAAELMVAFDEASGMSRLGNSGGRAGSGSTANGTGAPSAETCASSPAGS